MMIRSNKNEFEEYDKLPKRKKHMSVTLIEYLAYFALAVGGISIVMISVFIIGVLYKLCRWIW